MKLILGKDNKKIESICNALSSITRLLILEEIKNEDCSHKKLAEKLGIKSSSITFNLKLLLDTGIISEEAVQGLLGRKKKIPSILENKIEIEL